MANVQQAAKWMQEGRRIRRPHNGNFISLGRTLNAGLSPAGLIVVFVDGVERSQDKQESAPFTIEALLAEDWEIAH